MLAWELRLFPYHFLVVAATCVNAGLVSALLFGATLLVRLWGGQKEGGGQKDGGGQKQIS